MNYIDINFKNLINEIKEKDYSKIFNHIKSTYQKLSSFNIASIEIFLAQFGYWGKLNYNNNEFEELENRTKVLKENINDIIWLYDNLNDYRSKIVLYGIINYWYNNNFTYLDKAYEKNYNHYFDLDLIKPNKDEVFIDIGSYTGDTIIDFINTYKNYKKIYAYEITLESINIMRNNLKSYKDIIIKNNAVADKNTIMYINNNTNNSSANTIDTNGDTPITCVTLDNDIKEKITMIKMDIEGSEYNALKGCINHLKNDTPKLLISVYHNHQDIIRIPKLIFETNNNYKFYLRCYGNKYYPTEIVLLAIPKNL